MKGEKLVDGRFCSEKNLLHQTTLHGLRSAAARTVERAEAQTHGVDGSVNPAYPVSLVDRGGVNSCEMLSRA